MKHIRLIAIAGGIFVLATLWAHSVAAPVFSLSSSKGGEGRGEISPISRTNSRFEPLKPQDAQVVDIQYGDLEVHGEEAQLSQTQNPSPQPSPRLGGARESTLAQDNAGNLRAADWQSLFAEGTNAMVVGEYVAAARAFEDSAKLQPAAGTFVNLGISEWRRGRAGTAILAWERALWLDPFEKRAAENLRFARQSTQAAAPQLTWYEIASTWLPGNVWVWIAGGGLWLAVGATVLPGIFRRRKTGLHQALASAGLCIFLFSITASIGVITRTQLGVVTKKGVELRLTPTQEAETITAIAAGSAARTLKRHGDFYYIQTADGAGWIARDQFGLICEE